MISYIPQLWHCSSGEKLPNGTSCAWRGAYPAAQKDSDIMDAILLVMEMGHDSIELVHNGIDWPTCPRCGGHRFKVQDLPIKGSPAWKALFSV